MKNWKIFSMALVSMAVLSACAGSPAGTSKGLTADDFSQSRYLREPAAVNQLLSDQQIGPMMRVIDVRTPAEYAAGCLNGAKNIDIEAPDFDTKLAALDKNADYLVYCRSGHRSAQAVAKMRQAGFNNIIEMQGGMNAWTAANEPVSTTCR